MKYNVENENNYIISSINGVKNIDDVEIDAKNDTRMRIINTAFERMILNSFDIGYNIVWPNRSVLSEENITSKDDEWKLWNR